MSNPKKGQYRSDMKEIAASKIYAKLSGVESHAHEFWPAERCLW